MKYSISILGMPIREVGLASLRPLPSPPHKGEGIYFDCHLKEEGIYIDFHLKEEGIYIDCYLKEEGIYIDCYLKDEGIYINCYLKDEGDLSVYMGCSSLMVD